MTTDTERRLIDEYLARLERAAQVLTADRRAELLDEIREHISTALAAADVPSGEAAVRQVLDRLGTPDEIVEAAAADDQAGGGPSPSGGPAPYGYGYPFSGAGAFAAVPAPVPIQQRSLALETWAVVMLTIGSILLPVIGWIAGVVLLWSSDRWRLREKLIATLIVPGGWGAFAYLALGGALFISCSSMTSSTPVDGTGSPVVTTDGDCASGRPWVTIGAFALAAVVTLLVPFVLLHIARKRAAGRPGVSGWNDIHPTTGDQPLDRPLGQI